MPLSDWQHRNRHCDRHHINRFLLFTVKRPRPLIIAAQRMLALYRRRSAAARNALGRRAEVE